MANSSAHGSALNIEDKNTCWNYVTATTDSLAQANKKSNDYEAKW